MNHWYCGTVPPLVGVAVNVTLVPAQIVVSDAAMDTDAGKFGLTVIAEDTFRVLVHPVIGLLTETKINSLLPGVVDGIATVAAPAFKVTC